MSTTIRFEAHVYDQAQGPRPVRTLKREFDVNDWKVFSQTERDVVVFGKEASALLLDEAFKKKKRLWWSRLWHRIKPW